MSPVGKRIAIITQRIYPFYHGGSEEVMYDYVRTLAQKHNVTVFTSFDFGAAQEKLNNVEFKYISKKIMKSNRKGNHSLIGIFSFSVGAFLNRRSISNFDVVVLDSIHYFYPKSFLKVLKKNNGKLVTIFYEAWYDYRKSGEVPLFLSLMMGIYINRLIFYSDAIISISTPTTKSLINNYKVNDKKVFTIPLGKDFGDIQNYYALKNLKERQYDVSYVGRFASIKRIEDLVDAISVLLKSGVQIKAVLIGDGPEKSSIERKIQSLGLKNDVQVLGFLDESDKFNILNDSKIFVLPSEREGFSLATLEAMFFGCIPVVSKPKYSEVFGVSHFVKNEITGLYYEAKDFNALANAIIRLLRDSTLSNILSENAIEEAKKYNISVMEDNIHKFITQILSQEI